MILLGLSAGLALLRRSIGAFVTAMMTSAAHKELVISVPPCQKAYNRQEAQYRLPRQTHCLRRR